MEYIISREYYRNIFNAIRKNMPKAQHKDVVEYLNKLVKAKWPITKVTII